MDLVTFKKIAREKLWYAVKIGRIKKPFECQRCFKVRPLQGHHEDYSKPLDVVWCCTKCHAVLDGPRGLGKKYRSRWGKGLLKPNDS